MFRLHIFLFVVLLLISINASVNAQEAQTTFDLEGGVRNEAVIPADVIAVLKSDASVDRCFQQKGEEARESDWFAASEYDLNGDGRKDLIIKARDGCLLGANQGPFWIFQSRTDGYLKILAESGLQLTILPKKVNAFHQIQISKTVSMKPASRTYTFKARKYR